LAKEAVRLLKPSIRKLLEEKAKRQDMHIVVMDPTKKPWECPFEEAVLYEESITDKSSWENPYDEMAIAKARQAWRNGRSNFHAQMLSPATLKDGDLVFHGSFEYEGVLVAASGVEGWFDVLVCGWVALAIQQLAQDAFQKFLISNPGARYLQ
jgi:hypothetical protein